MCLSLLCRGGRWWLRPLGLAVALLAVLGWESRSAHANPVVFQSAGSDKASMQGQVDAFRTALGAQNPNVVGSLGSGRREINWDGVGAGVTSPNNFPGNFFNVNSPRGVVFSTPGSGFQVSANDGQGPVRFENFNAEYRTEFQAFSAQKLFTSLGSTITDISFFVPGTTELATVSAFGAVFTDVDQLGLTSISYFDTNDTLLGTFNVPVADGGLSFLGVQFTEADEQIARVRITAGNSPLDAGTAEGAAVDVVAMDDFVYAEPVPRASAAVPEKGTAALMLLPFVGMALLSRRRRENSPVCA